MVNANSLANEGMPSNAPAETRHEDRAGATKQGSYQGTPSRLAESGKIKAAFNQAFVRPDGFVGGVLVHIGA